MDVVRFCKPESNNYVYSSGVRVHTCGAKARNTFYTSQVEESKARTYQEKAFMSSLVLLLSRCGMT